MWALTGLLSKRVRAGDIDSKTKMTKCRHIKTGFFTARMLAGGLHWRSYLRRKGPHHLYGRIVIWPKRNKSRCALQGMCQQSLGGWPSIQRVLEQRRNCSHNTPTACFGPGASQQLGQHVAMARLKMNSPWGTPRIYACLRDAGKEPMKI